MLRKRRGFRRGIAILPSLFTVGNMFCGFFAIIASFNAEFQTACSFILLAGLLDGLDGRIARITNTTSDFGVELDSLSDFLSFGIAPSLIVYLWGLMGLGRLGWLIAFFLPVAGAMRLARFNLIAGAMDKRYFVGLPIPAAAFSVVLPIYFFPNIHVPRPLSIFMLFYVLAISLLMVSTLKYRSFKDLDMKIRRPSTVVLWLAMVFVIIFINPPAVLLSLSGVYLISGIATYFWHLIFKRRRAISKHLPDTESEKKQ